MDNSGKRHFVGGPCEYKTYPGTATIVSVRKPEGPDQADASKPVGYEVRFSFSPQEAVQEDWVRVQGKEHLLMLRNSCFPGSRFLERYGIEPGKCFECDLKVITKGTCTPLLFDFPAIDLTGDSE